MVALLSYWLLKSLQQRSKMNRNRNRNRRPFNSLEDWWTLLAASGTDRLKSGPVLQILVFPTQPRGGSVMFSFSNSSCRDWATTATASAMWADSFLPLISWRPSRPAPHTRRYMHTHSRSYSGCKLKSVLILTHSLIKHTHTLISLHRCN